MVHDKANFGMLCDSGLKCISYKGVRKCAVFGKKDNHCYGKLKKCVDGLACKGPKHHMKCVRNVFWDIAWMICIEVARPLWLVGFGEIPRDAWTLGTLEKV